MGSPTIRQYTNREYLLNDQDYFDMMLNNTPGTSIFMPFPSDYFPNWSTSAVNTHLTPNNRVDIDFLVRNSDSFLTGKFFLCRNIAPPYRMASLMTIVEDPKGEKAVRLALYNFTNANDNFLKVLPIGQILAIKNPWFKSTMDGGYTVRVDDPSNVVYVDDSVFVKMFPGLEWLGIIPEKYKKTTTKTDVVTNTLKQLNLESKNSSEYKVLGKKHFEAKQFKDAVQAFTSGLDLAPNDLEVLDNRADAYISLGYFHRALEDAEKVLGIDPKHLNGIYGKAKSLIGLKRYECAVDFLELINEKNQEVLALITLAKSLKDQQHSGTYDWLELYSTPNISHEDITEFVGAVKIVDVPGKGRGVIATEDIPAGQILMTNKAFAIAHHVRKDDSLWEEVSYDAETKMFNPPGHVVLVNNVMDKLRAEPEHSEELSKMYAGPKFESGDSESQPESDSVNLNKKRIDAICVFNAFGGKVNVVHSEDMAASGTSEKVPAENDFKGIWILPSNINHSCWDCNAIWTILGDFMVVRSFKKISKGEEVSIPYTTPTEPYSKREEMAKKHGFICTCKICEIQRNMTKDLKLRRKKLLKRIENCSSLSQLPDLITKLEKMHSEHLELNISCAVPLGRVARDHFKNNRFRECSQVLIKARALVENSPFVQLAAKFSVNIVAALIWDQGSEEEIHEWMNILKNDLLIGYGSLEVMKLIGPETLKLIDQAKLNFY